MQDSDNLQKKLNGINKQKRYLITQLIWEDYTKLHRGNYVNPSGWERLIVRPSYSKHSPKDSTECRAYEYFITVIITLNATLHRRLISANLNQDLPNLVKELEMAWMSRNFLGWKIKL